MPAPENLTASITKNALFGVVAKGAQVGTRLVTIPFVISHLGLDGYGIWNVIMAVAAYMRFGSVGVKSAFQKYVAEATGSGEYRLANELLSTGCVLMCILSVALVPVAVFSRPLAAAAGIPLKFLDSGANAIAILALIMAVSNVGSVFEAVVMGGHRVDLTRKFSTLFTILEAVAIVVVLHRGLGLAAMASVMAASELAFVACAAFAARRVVPEIRLARAHVTRRVIPELCRFAGSYQLVSVLEVLYAAILPVAILRTFGADASGVYAVATRLTSSAQALSESLLVPILSGSAMIYASGATERLRTVILTSFKAVVGLSLFPLGFIAVFGARLVYIWTGRNDPIFPDALWLISLAAFFQSVSLLQLVLYRASGKALLDNLRQVLRIIVLALLAVILARPLGFCGTLTGLAAAECIGMLFMLYAIADTFQVFLVRALANDAVRLILAAAVVLGLGVAGMYIPTPAVLDDRLDAAAQVAKAAIICAATFWPALRLTSALSAAERQAVRAVVLPRRAF